MKKSLETPMVLPIESAAQIDTKKEFRVNTSRLRKSANRKRRIERRFRDIRWRERAEPMYTASNIHYELSDRTRGIDTGGIGASPTANANSPKRSG